MYNIYITYEPETIFSVPTSVLEFCAHNQVRWVGERQSLQRARVYFAQGRVGACGKKKKTRRNVAVCGANVA